MKNNTFKINVGDLLQSAGKIDQVSFKNEKIENINFLSDDGISGDIMIQSFDQDSLLVTLEDITATINDPCDICNKTYKRELNIDEYSAKFQKKIDKDEFSDDDIFKIDGSSNIDIKDLITQSILLKEPLAKRCAICSKKTSNESDNFDYLEGTGNITFS